MVTDIILVRARKYISSARADFVLKRIFIKRVVSNLVPLPILNIFSDLSSKFLMERRGKERTILTSRGTFFKEKY